MSFPLAQLFEFGGATIWPPALLHFVTQGTIKLLVFTGDTSSAFPYVDHCKHDASAACSAHPSSTEPEAIVTRVFRAVRFESLSFFL